jgi:hypothetical protein
LKVSLSDPKTGGLLCIAAALVSGVLKGIWGLYDPMYSSPEAFAATGAAELWVMGALEVFKSVGFIAGLYAFYWAATRRGMVTKIFLSLAILGGTFFSAVHLWMAATTHFTLAYVLGGMWYQMIAPVAFGIAALAAKKIAWWKAAWAVAVGVLNSQIFTLLAPERALIVQGIIWLVFGIVVYTLGRTIQAERIPSS